MISEILDKFRIGVFTFGLIWRHQWFGLFLLQEIFFKRNVCLLFVKMVSVRMVTISQIFRYKNVQL